MLGGNHWLFLPLTVGDTGWWPGTREAAIQHHQVPSVLYDIPRLKMWPLSSCPYVHLPGSEKGNHEASRRRPVPVFLSQDAYPLSKIWKSRNSSGLVCFRLWNNCIFWSFKKYLCICICPVCTWYVCVYLFVYVCVYVCVCICVWRPQVAVECLRLSFNLIS